MDFDLAYRVTGYPGIAWHVWHYEKNRDRVVCSMVGDDREFTFDVDELTPLGKYCPSCGQIDCTALKG